MFEEENGNGEPALFRAEAGAVLTRERNDAMKIPSDNLSLAIHAGVRLQRGRWSIAVLACSWHHRYLRVADFLRPGRQLHGYDVVDPNQSVNPELAARRHSSRCTNTPGGWDWVGSGYRAQSHGL